MFELIWTPPRDGRVVIYRGQTGPSAGGDGTELPEAALDQIGLGPELQLTQPVSQRQDEHGRLQAVMSGVSWPGSWSRAYFTPVTLLAGRALLGRTLTSVRTGVIGDVDLAEYCNKQALTFDWPAGAAAVVVHLAPKGHDPRNGLTGKSFEISLEEYEKYGGMQFSKQELPATGCSLHLAPVAFGRSPRRRRDSQRRVCGAPAPRVRGADRPGSRRLAHPRHHRIALAVRPARLTCVCVDQQSAAHPAVDARRTGGRRRTGQRTRPNHRGDIERTAVVGADHSRSRRDMGGESAWSSRLDSAVCQHSVSGAVAHHRAARPAHGEPAAESGGTVNIRYGQLAYTSFDKPGSVGGWQIKQISGELSAAEAQTLVAGVRTAFDTVDPLPAYPTPEQLERGPRRLAYRRIDDRSAGYWHTVPAGSDNTGRPGNVFAHTLLDRDPDAAPHHRPIQWWRSPQWLCPYGAAAVARVVLPDEPPGPAAAVTKDSVVAFALDTSTWRLATLFGLLDAVVAALDGGAPVVLGVESVDAAAQWIGLVSYLMSPGAAARLNFSTFDRADQLGPGLQNTQHLTAVPVVDLPGVPAGVVVIDETATLSLGELGGEPHRTETGQPIAVTPWSAMAQVVLLEPRSARAVLDDIDRYGAQVEDSALPPAWPMAMAVAAAPEYADAHAEAHTVIAAHTPRGVAPGSVIGATISGVLNALVGNSTADAWHAVQHAPPGRPPNTPT